MWLRRKLRKVTEVQYVPRSPASVTNQVVVWSAHCLSVWHFVTPPPTPPWPPRRRKYHFHGLEATQKRLPGRHFDLAILMPLVSMLMAVMVMMGMRGNMAADRATNRILRAAPLCPHFLWPTSITGFRCHSHTLHRQTGSTKVNPPKATRRT